MIILWIGRNPVSLMRGERHVPVRHTPLTLETIETIHRIGLDTLLLRLRVDMQVRSLKSAWSGLE